MKILRSLLVVMLSVLFLASCGDKKNEPDPAGKTNGNVAAPGQMIAKINDTLWTSQTAYVGVASPSGLTIYGHGNSKMVYLTVGGAITKPGRFDAFTYNSVAGWYTKTKNNTSHTWTSITTNKCQLIVTKIDWSAKKMSGSFSFLADWQASSAATGSFRISEGSFTDIPINMAAPAASVKMEAQVNNMPWKASGMYIYGAPGFYQLFGSDVNGNVISFSGIDLQTGTNSSINSWATYSEPVNNDFDFWITPNANAPTIQITSYDPVAGKASGTFSFTGDASGTGTATGTKIISQGTFTDVPVF